ncbi:MAG: hypothetical protein ACRDJU_10860 [Actinomycetota bacterium]
MNRMKAMRRLVMVAALVTWVFTWTLLHGASSFFGGKGLPEWLAVLFFLPLLLSIGATITGAMRLPVWPWLAIFSGIALVITMLGVQTAELKTTADALRHAGEHPGSVTILLALQTQFKQGAAQVFFFIVAPVVLVGTGIVAWLNGPRRIFAPEGPLGGSLPEGPHAA